MVASHDSFEIAISSNLQIPKKLCKRVDRELQPGEFIRWVEQPIPQLVTVDSALNILLGIPWTGIIMLWIWQVLSKLPNLSEGLQPQHLFALWGVPFVLIGFGMVLTALWIWQAARGTVYVVTNKRAISIQCSWTDTQRSWTDIQSISTSTIRCYLIDQLKDVHRKERANGTGDVILAVRRWEDSDGYQRSEELRFLGVRNSRKVENILRKLIRNNP